MKTGKTTIKDILRSIPIGDVTFFRFDKRRSVRTIATDLKKDEGLLFTTGEFKNIIYVERVKNQDDENESGN